MGVMSSMETVVVMVYTHVVTSMSHMLKMLNLMITPPLAVMIGLPDSFGAIFFSSCILDALFVEEVFFG